MKVLGNSNGKVYVTPQNKALKAGDNIRDYFTETISSGTESNSGWMSVIKQIPDLTILSQNCDYMFNKYTGDFDFTLTSPVGGITSAGYMFNGCTNLISIPDLNWANTVVCMRSFSGCLRLTDISSFPADKATNMSNCFNGCKVLEKIPDTYQNATSMDSSFYGCSELIGNINSESNTLRITALVATGLYSTFSSSGIINIELDTPSVTTLGSTFFNCRSLKTVSFHTSDNTKNVTNFSTTFSSCDKLESVNNLDLSAATNLSSMFNGCTSLNTITNISNIGKGFTNTSASYSSNNLDLSYCPLTIESAKHVMDGLYDLSSKLPSTSSRILYLKTSQYSAAEKDELTSYANAKGLNGKRWALAYK